MPSPQLYRAEYSRRINRVLDYIDRHLDTPLDLDELAVVANFSRYHFHRVFAAWMGETLGDYARRRRLECGAIKLAQRPDIPILEIALATGFGSGEAFSRAFKLKFGCTPSAWRADTEQRRATQLAAMRARSAERQSNPDQADSNSDQALGTAFDNHEVSQQPNGEINMNVRIIDLPEVKVAYQRHIGPYGAPVSAFWAETFKPWLQANALDDQTCYGIGHDDPSLTPPEKCRYDACVEVPDSFQATGKANLTTLPGGRYAVAQFKGTVPAIGDAWTEMLREWLPSSGMQFDARPCFERYSKDASFDPKTGEFECELCIPVRPL
ncbi:AraC family transcriptional regulator [Paraherbaspirillum soli]|uniref:GyrI-like domain-containing protein n=1 Tax=Paraherbaspirillum soli TaxID=631222 RepID=A0ABW0MBU6_9BURK